MPEYVAFRMPSDAAFAEQSRIFDYASNDLLLGKGVIWVRQHDDNEQPYYEVRCPKEDEAKVRQLCERYCAIRWRTELDLRAQKFSIFKEVFGLPR